MERVLLALPADEHNKRDAELMLIAFSLTVGGNYEELINAFFRISSKNGVAMTNVELETLIGDVAVLLPFGCLSFTILSCVVSQTSSFQLTKCQHISL